MLNLKQPEKDSKNQWIYGSIWAMNHTTAMIVVFMLSTIAWTIHWSFIQNGSLQCITPSLLNIRHVEIITKEVVAMHRFVFGNTHWCVISNMSWMYLHSPLCRFSEILYFTMIFVCDNCRRYLTLVIRGLPGALGRPATDARISGASCLRTMRAW